jgi:hypothetical protein
MVTKMEKNKTAIALLLTLTCATIGMVAVFTANVPGTTFKGNAVQSSPPGVSQVLLASTPLTPPVLNLTTPDPTTTGTITLVWNSVPGATSYSVYENTTMITSVAGDTPVENTTTTTYTATGLAPGTYNYVVTANNATSESAISNVQGVIVSSPPISGFPVWSISLIAVVAVMGKILSIRLGRSKYAASV